MDIDDLHVFEWLDEIRAYCRSDEWRVFEVRKDGSTQEVKDWRGDWHSENV